MPTNFAQIHNAAVGHHSGIPVIVLFETQAADVLAVRAEQVEVGDIIGTADAWHPHEGGCRIEDDASVRQIDAVVVIDIRVPVGSDQGRLGLAQEQFEDLPAFVLADG